MIVLSGGFFIAGVAVASVYGWRQDGAGEPGTTFDPVISGSIRVDAAGSVIAPPAEFSISNTVTQLACVAERGGTFKSRSRSFFVPQECNDVWPRLSAVRSWTQDENGRVTLSDDAGLTVLTFVREKGLTYETVEPAGASIALQMLP